MKSNHILILGSSSWLGYLLTSAYCRDTTREHVAGTIYSSSVAFSSNAVIYRIKNPDEYIPLLQAEKPSIIVNLLRGEEENDFRLHKQLLEYCLEAKAHYVYASSVLALDAYEDQCLTEDLLPKAKSKYGVFKSRCEESIVSSGIPALIFRCASVQGWVPHKATRNEIFLEKVSRGKSVSVDTGVIQNRLFADVLIDILMDLIAIRAEGVFHLGTQDSSEEVDFLRREAEAFGWAPSLVCAGNARDINMVASPHKIYDLFGDKYLKTERDTIQSLLSCEGLSKYIKRCK